MVTASTLDVAEFTRDGVTWKLHDITQPGGCKLYDWCDGQCECEDHDPGSLGEAHGREIAVATINDRCVVTVDVQQWKADPNKPIRDGGTVFWKNQDDAPKVLVATWAERKRGAFLHPADALTLGYALRLTGHTSFAQAMYDAVAFINEHNGWPE